MIFLKTLKNLLVIFFFIRQIRITLKELKNDQQKIIMEHLSQQKLLIGFKHINSML